MKIKKVLIVHPEFYKDGGAERVIVRLANYLTNKNIEVTILTTNMLPEIKQQFKEARILQCKDFAEMSNVFQLICQDFDVINIHNSPAQLLPFTRKLNTVWMCNEPPGLDGETYNISNKEKQMVQNHIKKVVVADKANQKRFKEIFNMDSHIVPYGIDYDFFSKGYPERMRDKYHLQNNFVVTQVALIHLIKNQLRTIEIFKEFKKKIPNAKLILAGEETDYKDLVEKKMVERGVADDVIFTGLITREDIRDLYHASDVMIQPCKAHGSWLSVFEAMSAGKPVLVSEEMTASSILEENKIGFVCKENKDFVQRMEKIKEVGFEETIGKNWVQKNLTWDKFCKGMLEVFECP